MAIIMNPVPNMTIKELKRTYRNRRANHLEKCPWRNFVKKYLLVRSKEYY